MKGRLRYTGKPCDLHNLCERGLNTAATTPHKNSKRPKATGNQTKWKGRISIGHQSRASDWTTIRATPTSSIVVTMAIQEVPIKGLRCVNASSEAAPTAPNPTSARCTRMRVHIGGRGGGGGCSAAGAGFGVGVWRLLACGRLGNRRMYCGTNSCWAAAQQVSFLFLLWC